MLRKTNLFRVLLLEELRAAQSLTTTPRRPSAGGVREGWRSRFRSSTALVENEEPTTSGRTEASRPHFRQFIIEDSQHRIKQSDVSQPAWVALSRLKSAGYEAFLVGGTVRDLVLRRTPKDIDIVTSAKLPDVQRLFEKCIIIGRRFPICTITLGRVKVEVSSFSTGLPSNVILPSDMSEYLKHAGVHKHGKKQTKSVFWSEARQMNAQRRDFTVNGLLYDPCSQVIYDYTGGMDDLRKGRLATIADPSNSFVEDPARILRAIRFAGRVGLTIDERTVKAMLELGSTALQIPEPRAQLEIRAILGSGFARVSMQLMWQYEVLDHIFPSLVDCLVKAGHPREGPLENCLLLEVLGRLDRETSLSSPADEGIIAALLAVPMLEYSYRTLKNKMKSGGNVKSKGSAVARIISQPENVVYSTLTRGILEALARPSRGYSVITKANAQKASRLLYYARGFRDAAMIKGIESEKKLIMAILGSKSLNWKKLTDLGIKEDKE